MIQFLCTAVLGAVIYTLVCLFDGEFIPLSGFIFSLLVTGIFVLPLRLVLGHALPEKSQRARALVAGIVLMAPVTLAALTLPAVHLTHGRIGFFFFWLVYLGGLVVAQFWPLSAGTPEMSSFAARVGRPDTSENTSGQGPAATVPDEVDRWNWGAFLLSWIWGIGNNTFIALLMFVPFVNVAMMFVLGAKGSAWAWRNKRWDSVEHFQRAQRNWARWGLGVCCAVIVVGFGVASSFKSSEAYQLGVAQLRSNADARAVLGTPIETGFPMGQIEVSGSAGSARLTFSAEGPRASGTVYLAATKKYGKWMLDEIGLDVEGQSQVISLMDSATQDTDR